MSVLEAVYFDGKSSARHAVSLVLSGGRLKVIGREIELEYDVRRVRRSLRIADTPRWLYLPGGGACVTSDNEAVDRITVKRRYERVLQRWESRPAYAALAVLLVAGVLWLGMDRGVPALAGVIAERIPVQAEEMLGREALAGLERFGMQPSALPASRQAALGARFDQMAKAYGRTPPYRLEFRSSKLGPNAFALPSGIIIMTDELVALAQDDREVLAVLAHELGHVRHRHVMRRLLEGSLTGLVLAGVTGDIASATSIAAAAPGVLLQLKYSRDNESEADAYAVDMMRANGLDPRYLGVLLSRLEAGMPKGARGIPTFLSTHPATEERAALAGGLPPKH
jgi:Zn-dependent protease with chaperone function